MIDRQAWMQWLDREFLGSSLWSWGLALGVFALTTLALSTLRALFLRRLRRRAESGKTHGVRETVLRLASSVSWLALLALALRVAVVFLQLRPSADQAVRWVVVLALAWQAALWAGIVVEALLDLVVARRLRDDADGREPAVASMGIFHFLAKLTAYAIVVLVALDNLGADITALLAGLGVGGIAIALAVQNIVGDLFSSMSITLDKPFVVGDFIVVGGLPGSVEHIGIKTTRVRALSGEQIVFGNSDLLASRIQNFKRMEQRRILFRVGVVYQTPHELLERIPTMLRESVEAQEKTRFDRAHFQGFGDFSLDFEIVYYVLGPEYNLYMDVQQAINLEIHRRFEQAGVEFAYPTQTLFLTRETESRKSEPSRRGNGREQPVEASRG